MDPETKEYLDKIAAVILNKIRESNRQIILKTYELLGKSKKDEKRMIEAMVDQQKFFMKELNEVFGEEHKITQILKKRWM